MKVTRDVIYDLLPAYFAGEVSGDSRALVEEFLETDVELRRMAERFRTRIHDRTGSRSPLTIQIGRMPCSTARKRASSSGRRLSPGAWARRLPSAWRS